jgi:hypothetical protein
MSSVLVDNQVNAVVDVIENFFTAAADTRIEAFTASNNTEVVQDYDAYLGSATAAIVPRQYIVRDKNHLGTGIVGQLLKAGESLYLRSSGGISFYITGKVIPS